MSLITGGVKRGETAEQISQAIAERFTDPIRLDHRTDKIARTETGIATMLGKEAAGRNMRRVLGDRFEVYKRWITIIDGRERDSHNETHLQRRKKNEKFSNGMRFPLDPAGDAEERINCRCDMIFEIEEKK